MLHWTPNEKRHLRLRPDRFHNPRPHRRRRQVDVVLGPALATSPTHTNAAPDDEPRDPTAAASLRIW